MQGVIQDPAGFMPTRDEYTKAQRVADNLAAQLAQARAENERLSAELRTAQAGWRGDQESLIHVTEQWHGAEKKLDAAAAEVARLTAALSTLSKPVNELKHHLSKDGEFSICRTDKEDMGWGDTMVLGKIMEDIDAALRGDPAPAHKCLCGWRNPHETGWRNPDCPVHGDPAPATGRE